jgi:hypothetical protein
VRLEPLQQFAQTGLEDEPLSRDDRVVRRMPAAEERIEGIRGGVAARSIVAQSAKFRPIIACASVMSKSTPSAAAASPQARAAKGSVSSMSPSMSKMTAAGRRTSGVAASDARRPEVTGPVPKRI